MRHLNYQHLLYFWTVAREGSVKRAAEALHLTPPTLSVQIKSLEEAVGDKLFNRIGRHLELSETGSMVKGYADDIFSLGAELAQRVRHADSRSQAPLRVGVLNSIAKLVAYRLLSPPRGAETPGHIICREGNLEILLKELAVHRLDLIVSDRPVPSVLNVKAYNHPLGASSVSLFAASRLVAQLKEPFPACLNDVPLLLPINTSALRRRIDEWFERMGVRPRIVGEFEDSALLKAFGEEGVGIFPAPTVIAAEVQRTYRAELVGQLEGIQESYLAITPQRKIAHPAVREVTLRARDRLSPPPMGDNNGT